MNILSLILIIPIIIIIFALIFTTPSWKEYFAKKEYDRDLKKFAIMNKKRLHQWDKIDKYLKPNGYICKWTKVNDEDYLNHSLVITITDSLTKPDLVIKELLTTIHPITNMPVEVILREESTLNGFTTITCNYIITCTS